MTVLSLLTAPADLMRGLGDAARAVAELPAAIERNLREANALISDARGELALLGDQVRRMMEQLDKMTTVTDRLVEGTQAITAAAHEAQRQMAVTAEQIAATNRTLEQIVRMAEPLDRIGKSVVERFLRVTGRREETPPKGE